MHPSQVVNRRLSAFEVVPKLGYDPMREYKRDVKTIRADDQNTAVVEGQPRASGFDSLAVKEKFKVMQRRIQTQNANNDKWIASCRGKRVEYGDPIQLRHCDSGMYLQHAKKSSEQDRQCQQIELVTEPSSQRVTFIVQARYQYRQDNDHVVYEDHILLFNNKYNCYLHVQEGKIKYQTPRQSAISSYRPLSPMRRQNPDELYQKLEANCSQNFHQWQVVSYRQVLFSETQNFIFSGDVVRLKHTESNGYICFDEVSKEKPGNPAYLRIFKGDDVNDKFSTNSLFEIEANLTGVHASSYKNNGQVLGWSSRGLGLYSEVRFRHINSGKLLAIRTLGNKLENRTSQKKREKKLVLTLSDVMQAEEVNENLRKIAEIEEANEYNASFNRHTDQRIKDLAKRVADDQVFQIENTIIESDPRVKNQSVVKIFNRAVNPRTGKFQNFTLAGEIKDPGEEDQNANDDSKSNIDPDGQSQKIEDGKSQLGDLYEMFPPIDSTAEDQEEHTPDEEIFTPMSFDQSDSIVINFTQIVTQDSMEDVFMIEKVPNDEIKSILLLHSCVPKIKEFIYQLRFDQASLSSPNMKKFEDILSSLIFFVISTDSKNALTCEGIPNKKHQKYLREIKIIDLLVDILIYPFGGENPMFQLENINQKSPITKICQLIYRLFKHCANDNQFNKFYVAQWISHFFYQSMITNDKNNLMSESTVSEILTNNRQLLDKQINMQVIENIVKICSDSQKNDRFINLVSALCQCNDEAIGSNQDDVCELLLEREEYASLLIPIEEETFGGQKKYNAVFDEAQYLVNGEPLKLEIDKMHTFFAQKRDIRLFNYFESTQYLISLMCLSRNYKGILLLEKSYSVDYIIDCFSNDNLPKKLRSYYGKILISLHIDKDPLEYINLPVLTRVWQDIAQAKINIPQSKAQISLRLLNLRDFVYEFFTGQAGIGKAYEVDLNQLNVEVLNLLEKMVYLGFYSNEEDLVKIMNTLISVLDGATDFTSQAEESAYSKFLEDRKQEALLIPPKPASLRVVYKIDKSFRYKNNESNQLLISIKKKCISILQKVIDIQNDIRLSRFLVEFYKSDQLLMSDKATCGPELFYLKNLLYNLPITKEQQELKEVCDAKVIKWMNVAYANKNLDMKVKSEKDLICILLDITIYQDSKLTNSGFTLLARYFSQKRVVIEYANQVQILQNDEEVAILKQVSAELAVMKKTAENSEFWLGKAEKEALIKAREFITQVEGLSELCVQNLNRKVEIPDQGGDENEDLMEMEQLGAGDDEFLNISSLVTEWDNEDRKIQIDDDEVNDEKNQRLLRNLRAYEIPMIIIKQQGLDQAEDQNPYLRVVEKCYIFLIKFVRNCKENQEIMLEFIEYYLEDMEYGLHSWELICEIFTNNEILYTYNLVPIIKKALKIIDALPKETQKKILMVSFLDYFLKTNGNYVRENQNLICTELTSSLRKNLDHKFVGEQGLKDLHLYILEMKNAYAEFTVDEKFLQEIEIPPELGYTIEYIRILGICSEGKNSLTESIASDKLSLSDLIANLRMADFCYPFKNALVSFMDAVFFDVEKDFSEENISKMWDIIQILYQDIIKFIEIQERLKAQKGGAQKRQVNNETHNGNLDSVHVDINKNFNIKTAFGSWPIVFLMEKYVFDTLFPAIQHYLEIRLPIKNAQQQEFYTKLLNGIQKSVSYAKKSSHFQNSKQLFMSIKKIPGLKECGGENLSNKLLSQYLLSSGNQNDEETAAEILMGMPTLTQAQKLKAYLISVGSSETLLQAYEKEFEEMVKYIISIELKSEAAFDGTNTIKVKDLISSLIKISDRNSDIDPNLKIICLKVIRKLIEMENKGATTPASQWDSEDFSMFKEEIRAKQRMLLDLGVINLLMDLIAYEPKRKVKEEVLQVCIAMCLAGNQLSQDCVAQYIKEDAQNVFMQSLKTMLMEALDFIKSSQSKRNEHKMKYIQVKNRISELEAMQGHTKQTRQELAKAIEQAKVLEEEINLTNCNDDENPATYTSNELTVKRAISNTLVILRFLQLLCENHNNLLQNIIREQVNTDNKKYVNSFDFISYIAKSIESFQDVLNNQTFDVCSQLVDTLVESIQGPCKGNQKAAVNSKIIDSSRELISSYSTETELFMLGFEDKEDIDMIGQFKQSIVETLTSLLEGEVDLEIITKMATSLDFNMMKQRILTIFTRFAQQLLGNDKICVKDLPLVKVDQRLRKDSFDGNVSEAFQIFILIYSLADSIKIAEDILLRERFTSDQWKVFEFIRSHTGRIEVNVNNNLQRIYFPIKPVCHFVSKGARVQLMLSVSRESQQTKVSDLISAVPDLIDEMNHNEELTRAALQITPGRLTALKDVSTFVGILINVLYLVFARRKFHYRTLDIEDWVLQAIGILGYVQGATSLVLIFFYGINKKELITKQKWREYNHENRKNGCELIDNIDRLELSEMSIEMTHMILMVQGPSSPEFNLGEHVQFGNFFTWAEYQILNVFFFAQDPTFQYFVFYLGISLLGRLSAIIYYAFHLFDVINRSPTLQNVIKSITSNIAQISLMLMLMVILLYIYTTIHFFYLQDLLYDYSLSAFDSTLIGEQMCPSMWECFTVNLDQGLRMGGGIGDVKVPVHYNDEFEKYLINLVHDATYQIVINVVCLNIIFGIIVSSFAELRDLKAKNDEDMFNYCYICNYERIVFDKADPEGGFLRHIEKDHNLWWYVFYIVHLESKETSDLSGIESYVVHKLEANDISWVPRQKALCLQSSKDEDEEGPVDDEMNKELELWSQRILQCVNILRGVNGKIEEKKKKKLQLAAKQN